MTTTGQSEPAPTAKQLVFLAMMATVVAVIVFLCGVLVGRGVPLRRATGLAATEAVPSGAGAIELGIQEIGPDPGTAPGSPLDDLSYFGLLNDTGPAPETLGAPADRLAEEPALEPAAEPQAAGPPADGHAPSLAPPLPVTSTVPAASFVVQVTALRGGDEAHDVAAGLVERGYPAFVVDPAPGAPVAVYRVRVGPYPDRGEAETVRYRLETEEQFKPWLVQL